jgi:hypothetical protein
MEFYAPNSTLFYASSLIIAVSIEKLYVAAEPHVDRGCSSLFSHDDLTLMDSSIPYLPCNAQRRPLISRGNCADKDFSAGSFEGNRYARLMNPANLFPVTKYRLSASLYFSSISSI